ncbi:hypothetical protein [Arthrobacter sp. MYb227]|uniref:hypothetical protein n=1 Tax=Arthrobacter sp. MYb227 TaxID=1848601 RepID=UPI0011B0821A|nr:hypothetical protein [Arthrobacter sp. MYb227]
MPRLTVREPKPKQPAGSVAATLVSVLVALAAGVLAAVVGTILHATIAYVGDTPLPWGAVLALILTGALSYWVGMWRAKLWVSALAGLATYVLVALFSADSHNQMIVSAQYLQMLPGPALAGIIWVYGIIVPVVVAIFLVSRHLRVRSQITA